MHQMMDLPLGKHTKEDSLSKWLVIFNLKSPKWHYRRERVQETAVYTIYI